MRVTAWHLIVLRDLEFIEFRDAIEREHQRKIVAGGSRGYRLYGRKRDTGDHVVFVPPEAFHLVEQLPNWKERMRRHDDTLDLAGFKAVLIR